MAALPLSAEAVRRLAIAVTDQDLGNEVASAIGLCGAADDASAVASVSALGIGDVNGKAFTVTAGAAGALTVTVGSHTGITVTATGTAATDAAALAAAIAAADPRLTVTSNAGDVRIVASGYPGSVGNALVTVVTASGGAKLSASGASLAGGFSAGGYSLVKLVADAAASTSLPGLLVGDLVLDLTTVADVTRAKVVVIAADTINFTPVAHDVLVVLRPLPAPTAFKF